MSSLGADSHSDPKTFYVNFNQDNTALLFGYEGGWKIFDINDGEDIRQNIYRTPQDVYLIEKLFASSLVAVVTNRTPRTLMVSHCKTSEQICHYSYPSSIRNVKMNRQRLCVVLKDSCFIHDIHTMAMLHTITDTPPNLDGLCDLSWGKGNSLLAYPSSSISGTVQIFDTSDLVAKMTIKAHESPLVALAFNPGGTLIATASVKGTLIRVHNVSNGSRVVNFRRGLSRCVTIKSLKFSTCGRYLGASSETGTIHIYKLPENIVKAAIDDTWTAYFSYYLPTRISDTWDTERDFATIHLPIGCEKKVIGLKHVGGFLRLIVATEEGTIYVHNINEDNGLATLVKTAFMESDTAIPEADPLPETTAIGPNCQDAYCKIDNCPLRDGEVEESDGSHRCTPRGRHSSELRAGLSTPILRMKFDSSGEGTQSPYRH